MTRILAARVAQSANITPPPVGGVIGQKYNWTFSITGIAQPYRYTIAGTLPPGVEWYRTPRLLQGIPTARGRYPITVTVVGADRIPIVFPFVIVIAAPLLLIEGGFGAAAVAQVATGSVTITGGTPGYHLVAVTGTPPPGITFVLTGDVIAATGTYSASGSWPFRLVVEDADGNRMVYQTAIDVGTSIVRNAFTTLAGVPYTRLDGTPYTTLPYLLS